MNIAELGNALGPWLQVLSVIGAVVQCLGTVALWALIKKFVTREDCEACRVKLEARLKSQEDSAGELHQAVSQAAPKEALAVADKADEVLRGEIKTLLALVEGLKDQQAATIQGLKDQQRALSHQVGLLIQHHLGGSR